MKFLSKLMFVLLLGGGSGALATEDVWQDLRTEFGFRGLATLAEMESAIHANTAPYNLGYGSVSNVKGWVSGISKRIEAIKKEAGDSREAYVKQLNAYGKELRDLRKAVEADQASRTLDRGDAIDTMYKTLIRTLGYLMDDFQTVK